MPDKIDWDGLIAEVLQRGPEVPEVPWFKPGEDAAYDVSAANSSSDSASNVHILIHSRVQMVLERKKAAVHQVGSSQC